jgi:hypothetical protein
VISAALIGANDAETLMKRSLQNAPRYSTGRKGPYHLPLRIEIPLGRRFFDAGCGVGPDTPPRNAVGKKTATSVNVVAMTARPISFAASSAATADCPS